MGWMKFSWHHAEEHFCFFHCWYTNRYVKWSDSGTANFSLTWSTHVLLLKPFGRWEIFSSSRWTRPFQDNIQFHNATVGTSWTAHHWGTDQIYFRQGMVEIPLDPALSKLLIVSSMGCSEERSIVMLLYQHDSSTKAEILVRRVTKLESSLVPESERWHMLCMSGRSRNVQRSGTGRELHSLPRDLQRFDKYYITII